MTLVDVTILAAEKQDDRSFTTTTSFDEGMMKARCSKDVYVNSFFSRAAKVLNSVPIECFPLTYDLNGFKSRINRHLLTVGVLSKQASCMP